MPRVSLTLQCGVCGGQWIDPYLLRCPMCSVYFGAGRPLVLPDRCERWLEFASIDGERPCLVVRRFDDVADVATFRSERAERRWHLELVPKASLRDIDQSSRRALMRTLRHHGFRLSLKAAAA